MAQTKSYGAIALDKFRASEVPFSKSVGWLGTLVTEGGRRELFEDGSSVYFPGGEIRLALFHDEEVTRESLALIGLHQAVNDALIL